MSSRMAPSRNSSRTVKTLWCWRCKRDIPMLEDDEWEVLLHAHRLSATDRTGAFELLRREARHRGLPAPRSVPAHAGGINARLWHLLAGYEMFTGFPETVANAV